jgi:hypothetical protein
VKKHDGTALETRFHVETIFQTRRSGRNCFTDKETRKWPIALETKQYVECATDNNNNSIIILLLFCSIDLHMARSHKI